MLANCDAIVLFSILSLFRTIPDTESGQMLHDIKIFSLVFTFYLKKNENRTKNS